MGGKRGGASKEPEGKRGTVGTGRGKNKVKSGEGELKSGTSLVNTLTRIDVK